MTLCYSRKTFLFLKPLIIYTSFFGILPRYNFETKKVYSSRLRIIFSVFLVCCLLMATFYGIYERTVVLYPAYNNKMLIVLDVFNDLIGLLWFTITCADIYLHKNAWDHLFHQITDLENCRSMIPENDKETCFWKNPFVQCCIFNISSLGIAFGTFTVWYLKGNELNPKNLFTRLILFYLESLIVIVTFNFILMLYHKYNALNTILGSKNCLKYNLLKYIRRTKYIYCKLDEINENFNQLFGKHLFYIFLIVAIHFLNQCSRLVQPILGTLYSIRFDTVMNIKTALYVFAAVVSKPLFAKQIICATKQ